MMALESFAGFAGSALGAAQARWRWRLNRLRCMAPAEVGHRLLRRLGMEIERRRPMSRAPAPAITAHPAPWIHVPPDIDPAPYLAAADRVVAGRFDVFALRDVDLGVPPRWNRDCKSGIEAPLSFGKLLDYRDPARVGDIKYLWEPNRHLHLVTLAQAAALSGRPIYGETIRAHLESWFDACPPGRGANWASALEPALRLINWSLAWQLLGGADAPLFRGAAGARFRERWLESVFQQMRFVAGHFSLYSSANNHLLGEAAGLFIAALTWPYWSYWPQARHWERRAQALLEREILLQNAPDGVNREQAVAYQHFVLDLLLFALLAGRRAGAVLAPACMRRIEAMLEFLASIMDAGGNVPMIGDSDDGLVARLAPQAGFCRYRSLLASGAILFGRGEFKAKAGALDDKSRWLLGAAGERRYRELAAGGTLPIRRAFPEGGYYILGRDFETPAEIRLLADAGPLGYPRIAAHGHADALSFTLSVAGLEFLIDPGTFAYHTQGPWRDYFRGTAAHNALRVDGRDQSESGGNFMWLRQAHAACRHWRGDARRDTFAGWHDGYRRLADPVLHLRRITFDKDARRILIEDMLRMSGEHRIELFFHVDERCAVEPAADGCVLRRAGATVRLRLPSLAGVPGAAIDFFAGSLEPIAGWVSRRFDDKQPTTTVRWQARLSGAAVLRSEILCAPPPNLRRSD